MIACIYQAYLDARKILDRDGFHKDVIRDRLHEFLNKTYDCCLSTEKPVGGNQKFSPISALRFDGGSRSFCFLEACWQFAVTMLVVICLLCTYYYVFKSLQVWNRVKPCWFVYCAVCVFARIFALSRRQQLNVVYLTSSTNRWSA